MIHYVISEVDMGEPILVSLDLLLSFMMARYFLNNETGRRDTIHQRRR